MQTLCYHRTVGVRGADAEVGFEKNKEFDIITAAKERYEVLTWNGYKK